MEHCEPDRECEAYRSECAALHKALADAQATVEALRRERDTARRRVDELEAREVDVVLLRHELDAEREKAKAIEKVLDIDSGKTTVEKVVDLKRSFAQVWKSYQDAANEMFEAQAQLTQLQTLVRALPDQLATIEKDLAPINLGTMTSDDMKMFDKTKALVMQTVMARLPRTLDATTPATMFKLQVSDEWVKRAADLEDGCDITAGSKGGDGE